MLMPSGAAAPAAWDPLLQYGAFGVCLVLMAGFFALCRMLLKNHREERGEFLKAFAGQSQEFKALSARTQGALENNTEALRRISEALGDRPCLAGDSRVRQG